MIYEVCFEVLGVWFWSGFVLVSNLCLLVLTGGCLLGYCIDCGCFVGNFLGFGSIFCIGRFRICISSVWHLTRYVQRSSLINLIEVLKLQLSTPHHYHSFAWKFIINFSSITSSP